MAGINFDRDDFYHEDSEDSYNTGYTDGRKTTYKRVYDAIIRKQKDMQVPGKHTEFVTYGEVLRMIERMMKGGYNGT
jgi:hypothetical protein